MEAIKSKINWFRIISFTLMFLLTAQIVFLIGQNRRLEAELKQAYARTEMRGLKAGDQVETVKVLTLEGASAELSYSDSTKKFLLFVLSTTCPHCENNLPRWKTIVSSKEAESCDIIGISIHGVQETRAFVVNKDVSFFMVSAPDTGFARKYKITGVPETILVDGKGTVEKTWIGELTLDQTHEILNLMGASRALAN